MPDRYAIARSAAIEAGKLALVWLEQLRQGALAIESKGVQDFVTRADRDVEQLIRAMIAEHFPLDGILGEEMDRLDGQNETIWVIDPIDGTANYIRDRGHWCISIACVEKKQIQTGIIYDPVREELFHAQRGSGAFKDDLALPRRDINQKEPQDPVINLGCSRRKPLDIYLNAIRYLHENNIEHRRCGSAAIGLAWVAEGKMDGYFEADLNPWDCMAGLLLLEETGCYIPKGLDMVDSMKNAPVIAGHPFLKQELDGLSKLV